MQICGAFSFSSSDGRFNNLSGSHHCVSSVHSVYVSCQLSRSRRRGDSVVGASDLGTEGREFEPWPVHPRCVLRQNTSLSQFLSPPRCINGNQQIACGQPDKMLGGNLRWTSIPSRGSRNTPSRFILQKPEISAGTDEPSGSPNYDWDRLDFTS